MEGRTETEEISKRVLGHCPILPSGFSHTSFYLDSPIMSLYSKGKKSPVVKIAPLISSSLRLCIQEQ